MRTTITLDPDVARQLKKDMADQGLSLKEAVNRTLRLGFRHASAAQAANRKVFRVKPVDLGFPPGVDLDRLNQLADEIEDETTLAKLRKDQTRSW